MTSLDRSQLTRVLTFLNNKGGVFKTSSVANVGGLLAAAGYRTLLIDLDPQGNLAEDLGYDEDSDEGASLFQALTPGSTTLLSPLENVRPNLDVLPGGSQLDLLATLLESEPRRPKARDPYDVLAAALIPLAGKYDFILIDTPPKVPVFQNIALGAARWLIIPTKPDASSRKGLIYVTDLFQNALGANPDLELLGVLLVGVSSASTRIRREVRASLADDLGENFLLQSVLRTSESSAYECRQQGHLIHELETQNKKFAQSANGLAQDYQALTTEIVAHMADAEANTTTTEGE